MSKVYPARGTTPHDVESPPEPVLPPPITDMLPPRYLSPPIHPPKPNLAGSLLMFIFTTAVPIVQIVLGILYFDDCPVEDNIPIYNIVSGSFSVTLGLLNLITQRYEEYTECDEDWDDPPKSASEKFVAVCKCLFGCFVFAWFITGSVWTYSIYEDVSYDSSSRDYCKRDLYLFTFWVLTVSYIFMALCGLCGVCGMLIFICCHAHGAHLHRRTLPEEPPDDDSSEQDSEPKPISKVVIEESGFVIEDSNPSQSPSPEQLLEQSPESGEFGYSRQM